MINKIIVTENASLKLIMMVVSFVLGFSLGWIII